MNVERLLLQNAITAVKLRSKMSRFADKVAIVTGNCVNMK